MLDVGATDKGMALKLEGQRASMALAEATGESLEGVLELQQRLTRMREHVEKSLAAAA